MAPVTRVELADLVETRQVASRASIPATVLVMREDADVASCRLVALRAPFQVLVAFDAAQTPDQVAMFADSLWASYAWYGTRKPTSLWTRVDAWLAAPETAALGQHFRTAYFPEWQEMRAPTEFDPKGALFFCGPHPPPLGWTPRPIQRPPSFIVDAKPLIGVEAPAGTWAEKRSAERHKIKEENARRTVENVQRTRDGRPPLGLASAMTPWQPPGTSHVACYSFESYHAALHVISRLMGNTGAGAIGDARPLGGKVRRGVFPGKIHHLLS